MVEEIENDLKGLSENFAKRARDFDDLQNELAGREVGRIARFLSNDARDARNPGSRRAKSDEAFFNQLLMLMSDPVYAALYEDTAKVLTQAESATEIALEKANIRLREAEQTLAGTIESAAKLDDGRRVFRDAQGRVWTEDTELLPNIDPAEIDWPAGSTRYEEFLDQKESVEQAQTDVDAILYYQVDVLGSARDRMSDPNNPPSMDELREMRERIDSEMPEFVRDEMPNDNEANLTAEPELNIATPKL